MGNETGCCLPALRKKNNLISHELIPTNEPALQNDIKGDDIVHEQLLESSTTDDNNNHDSILIHQCDVSLHDISNNNDDDSDYDDNDETITPKNNLNDGDIIQQEQIEAIGDNEIFIPQKFQSYSSILNILLNTLCCIGVYDSKLHRWRTAVYSKHFDKTQRIVVRFTNSRPLPVDQDNLCDKYFCLIGFPVDNVSINSSLKISLSDLTDLSNLPIINIKKWMIREKRPIIKAYYRHCIQSKYKELGEKRKYNLINGYIRYLYTLNKFKYLRFPSIDIISMIISWHDGNFIIDDILTLITAFSIKPI